MGFLRRTASDEDTPMIHVYGQGTISGRKVSDGGGVDGMGTFTVGRRAGPHDIESCRRFWPQAQVEDFGDVEPGVWFDRASGQVYDRLISDPLLSKNPRELCSLFTVQDETIVFLRARDGVTVADLERAEAEHQAELEQEETKHAKFLAAQQQLPFRVSEVFGERVAITLREAARRLLDSGGRIERGPLGELVLTGPARLTGEPTSEHGARQELALCAEVLASSRPVVMAALEDEAADTSKKPKRLDERLPDREPAFGGGVA